MKFVADEFDKRTNEGITVYIDGSGKGYCIAVIHGQESEEHHFSPCTPMTNKAEYSALVLALEKIKEDETLTIVTDNELLFKQLKCEYVINDPELVQLAERVKKLIEEKRLNVTLKWVARQFNKADYHLRKHMKRSGALMSLQAK